LEQAIWARAPPAGSASTSSSITRTGACKPGSTGRRNTGLLT
jgi:hypothetical protein